MQTLKTAVFGAGFIGRVHLEAIRRLGAVQICAIADSQVDKAESLAAEFCIERVAADYHRILEDPAIDVVHICTPNALHFPMVQDALQAGKHVICEKPLATSAEHANRLVDLAAREKRRNCTCYNLRCYPVVQQIRRMREEGELGDIVLVQGVYLQDWLMYDTDWNWRIDSTEGGASRCMADIGSHWLDMAEHVTGQRISSLCADLQTFHKTRRRPKGSVETFAGKILHPENYVEVPINTEDCGVVIFRMGERIRGSLTASQVSAGRKNYLGIEIAGSRSSAAWNQERPDELWIGHRNTENQVLLRDPSLLKRDARSYADLPGGHSEGYDDTFKQLFRRFYRSITNPDVEPDYPQFVDGLRQLAILKAELESHQTHGWVDVPALLGVPTTPQG